MPPRNPVSNRVARRRVKQHAIRIGAPKIVGITINLVGEYRIVDVVNPRATYIVHPDESVEVAE